MVLFNGSMMNVMRKEFSNKAATATDADADADADANTDVNSIAPN